MREILSDPERSDDFRSLTRELYLVATDLDSCERAVFGAEGLDHVPISRAVSASSALPMIYKPVTIDGQPGLPAVKKPLTLECAGNGRVFLTPAVQGLQWGTGAVGTAEWAGVNLGVGPFRYQVMLRSPGRSGLKYLR